MYQYRKASILSTTVLTWMLLILIVAVAVLIGLVGGVAGWFAQLLLITVAVPLLVLLVDYRYGLIALVF
jgi:hypothetical protein